MAGRTNPDGSPVVPLLPSGSKMQDPLYFQQHNEGDKVYSYFRLYRELGRTRTMAAVAEEVGVRPETIYDHASTWYWAERVAAWDQHIEKAEIAVFEDEARIRAVRQARLGQKLQDASALVLAKVLDDSKYEPSIGDAVRLAEAGVKIERAARGTEDRVEGPTVVLHISTIPAWARTSKPVIDGTMKIIEAETTPVDVDPPQLTDGGDGSTGSGGAA